MQKNNKCYRMCYNGSETGRHEMTDLVIVDPFITAILDGKQVRRNPSEFYLYPTSLVCSFFNEIDMKDYVQKKLTNARRMSQISQVDQKAKLRKEHKTYCKLDL
jgi:hypothetical protein